MHGEEAGLRDHKVGLPQGALSQFRGSPIPSPRGTLQAIRQRCSTNRPTAGPNISAASSGRWVNPRERLGVTVGRRKAHSWDRHTQSRRGLGEQTLPSSSCPAVPGWDRLYPGAVAPGARAQRAQELAAVGSSSDGQRGAIGKW